MLAIDRSRPVRAAAILVTVGATVVLGATVPAAVAAAPSITFQDPGSVVAGPVELRGVVTTEAAPTTTVLYVLDVSQSTKTPSGVDCNADGVAGSPADNLNGDTGVGDTLDCEIGAVKSINAGLAASPGRSLASLETFAGGAAPVNLVPGSSPATLFVAPGASGAGGQPAVVAAAATLRRDPVPGTSYDPAVTTALSTLRGAPAGPKYIMLLTDGGGNASSSTISALTASGVRLRSFAIGNDKGCSLSSDLRALSEASGDACYEVTSPAGLPPVLGAAQPPKVSAVQVALGGRTYSAALDLAGGWRLPVTLGAGTWAATATAVLTDGSRVAAQRTFVVKPSDSGPPPGTVAGPSSAATVLKIDRPGATTSAVPRKVTGLAGSPVLGSARAVDGLQNAALLLQGRSVATKRWVTVGRAQVGATGRFAVYRTNVTAVNRLQVVLLPRGVFTGASAGVPAPTISSCRTVRRGAGFRVRCLTVAPKGATVRLLKRGAVVDRTVVRLGAFRVAGHGARHGHVLLVTAASGVTYRLLL